MVETAINSDVEGYFTAKVSTNVYDTATGRHLLVPQGSTILGHDQSAVLLYGNERLPTISLTLALPDGRSVDLGQAPVTDQQGAAGLTGRVNNHFWRNVAAIFIGGTLRGGMQALQIGMASQAGAGQVAAGTSSVGNQVVTPRNGLDARLTRVRPSKLMRVNSAMCSLQKPCISRQCGNRGTLRNGPHSTELRGGACQALIESHPR